MADNTKWTDEQERELKERWAARDSCAVIGRALGFTRCAVAGKIRRLGITRGRQEVWTGNIQPVVRATRAPRAKTPPPVLRPPADYRGPVATVALLAHRGCRFVTSDDLPFMHCNREGFPWCSKHRAVVWRRAGAVEA
jgi:hypothetical protein